MSNARLACALVAALLAGAVSIAGCGGSDGEASGDEQRIRDAYMTMQRGFYSGDGALACGEMTDRGRSQFAALGSGKATCEQRLRQLFPGIKRSKDPRPTIVSVKVDNERAVIAARKTPGRPLLRVAAVEEDGEWKIDGAPTLGN